MMDLEELRHKSQELGSLVRLVHYPTYIYVEAGMCSQDGKIVLWHSVNGTEPVIDTEMLGPRLRDHCHEVMMRLEATPCPYAQALETSAQGITLRADPREGTDE